MTTNESGNMVGRGAAIGLIAAALVLFFVLGFLNLFLGDLNQDEGWYLYSALQIAQGRMLYRDFAFTQGPAIPHFYRLFAWVIETWGLAGGRFITLLTALAGAWLAAALAARLVPASWKKAAFILAFTLIAGNVYQSSYTTVVKTYSLCAFFLCAALLALSGVGGKRSGAWAFLSGILFTLAAAARASAGVAAPLAFLFLVYRAWTNRTAFKWAWFWLGAGGVLTATGVFLPFYLFARDGLMFGLFEYHTLRSAGGLLPAMVYKAGFVSRMVQAYYLPICLGLAALLLFRLLPRSPGATSGSDPAFPILLAATVGAVTLVHLSAPFPYEDYQVLIYPLFCALVAVGIIRVMERMRTALNLTPRAVGRILLLILLVSTASAFSSPVNQNWMIAGRDRIWWKIKEQPALARLQDVAQWLNEYGSPGGSLLTQDTYLAVEAGMSVPEGLEMGPFSYYPDFPTDKARRLHVLNRELMLELLETTEAPLAAISGYSLTIRSPEVIELSEDEQYEFQTILRRRYDRILEVPDFGQAFTTLQIYRLRLSAASSP